MVKAAAESVISPSKIIGEDIVTRLASIGGLRSDGGSGYYFGPRLKVGEEEIEKGP